MLSSNYPSVFYSVEWVGKLLAPSTETYRIHIDTFNTSFVELYLNGTQVIVNHFNQGKDPMKLYYDVDLTKGSFTDLHLRYAQRLGVTKLIFLWESDSLNLEVIPTDNLYNELYSSTTPFTFTCIPDISNATTTTLTNNNYQIALVGIQETLYINARDKFSNLQIN
jgi:hypothetical protein